MLRRIALIILDVVSIAGASVAEADVQPEEPDLTCSGTGDDGTTSYNVDAYKDDSGRPIRVVLERDGSDVLGDFTNVEDLTPAPPTDELYRLVLSTAAGGGDYAVMMMEGGFTGMATAQVFPLGRENPPPIATLNCR